MPIFPDYRKISHQKLKQNKSKYSQKLIKSTRHSPPSSSHFTDQNSNVKSQNEFWKGIYPFFNKAGLCTGG